MTSANIPSRLYIPQAFASGTGAALATIGATSSEDINFVDGFPSAYSASNPNGGKFVTRAEMNAIGNLASVNEYARACGGIVTFDPQLCVKIGGYPRGAVLEILQGLDYNKVISLVENNMVDFRGATNTSTYTTITNGSVDGINWAYLGNGTISYAETLCEIGTLPSTKNVTSYPLGGFCAPRTGIPYFDGDITITDNEESGSTSVWNGYCKIYLIEGGTTASSLDNATPTSPGTGNTSTLVWTNLEAVEEKAHLKCITAGKYYSLWMTLYKCGITSSTLKFKLS